MKEGSSVNAGTIYYSGSSRINQDLNPGEGKPRSSRSRFDVEYPIGSRASSKWDVEKVEPPKVSILEDYLLEDEESNHRQRSHGSEGSRKWDDMTTRKDINLVSSKPLSTANMSQGNWQAVGTNTGVPPPGFPGYSQPPPVYEQPQPGFYPFDYQQQPQPPPPPQIYSGYNYFPGFQNFPQSWGGNTDQPPPPGLILPDMTQPPPMQLVQESTNPPMGITDHISVSPPRASSQSSNKQPSLSPKEHHYSDDSNSRKEELYKEQQVQETELQKQRAEYMLKYERLSKELESLKEQKQILLEEGASENGHILKENNKLQSEIKKKLVAINNVVDMLSGLLVPSKFSRSGDKRKHSKSSSKERQSINSDSDHKSKSSKHSSSSSSSDEEDEESPPDGEKINYSFFDPEEHWCRVCDVFPASAKEFLHHLQTEQHKDTVLKKKLADLPWHKNIIDKERPHYRGAPTKRVPIKGLQFFIAPTAWYCKLCDVWIGDLHCASLHLKSKRHMANYEDFLSKNEDWESQWSTERKEAMARTMEEQQRMQELKRVRELIDDEDISTSRLESAIKMRDSWRDSGEKSQKYKETLKAKVSTNEAYEQEDLTRSIRVAMRNKSKPTETTTKSLPPMGPALPPSLGSSNYKRLVEPSSIPVPPSQNNGSTQGQWVVKQGPSNTISESERQLLKNLKDKLKQKQEKDDLYRRGERVKERKKDHRFQDRSHDRDRSRSRNRSRSHSQENSRGRSRSRSRGGRDYSRERDYSRGRDRSRSRDRRKHRRSSSPRRGRSRSHTPERKTRKADTKQWVPPPSSPLPYITRKTEDKDKWDKPKKKPAPNPVSALPKSKLPFIGRMPLLKHIAKKKQSDEPSKSESRSSSKNATEHRAPEDMDIDSGASDNEQTNTIIEEPALGNDVSAPTVVDAKSEIAKGPGGIPLPQDFQDALCILFPEDMAPEDAYLPPTEDMVRTVSPRVQRGACNISQEELLMLGIDPEDLVAQGLSKE